MKFDRKLVTPEMTVLLRESGDATNKQKAVAALNEVAKALTLPLKQGVMNGDIITGIFEPIDFPPGTSVEFPLDFLSPGSEGEFVAYVIPSVGRIPERHINGDYIMVPTFEVGSSIDWPLRYSRDARWDVVGRALQVLESSFVHKANKDGWHTLLAAGVDRNLVVSDTQSVQGLFTKRLVTLMTTIMRRNAGGNSTSVNQGKLTDLWMSPEAIEDVRSWDLTQIDDFTRRDIFLSGGDTALTRIFGVTLHAIDELGVGQDFQDYFDDVLGGSLPASTEEIVVGLDLVNRDSFVMPMRQEVEIFEDPNFHRQRRAGLYGWGEHGFSVLDGRRILLGAL